MLKNLHTEDVKKSKTEGESISAFELKQLREQAAKVEDLEKALSTATDKTLEADLEKATTKTSELEAKLVDLEKAAAELADLKKAAADKVVSDTVDVVKGFNLFDEDKVEDVAKFFVANAGTEVNLILETLEKSRKAIKEFGEEEHGSDHEGVTTDLTKSEAEVATLGNSVLDIIKARKNEK